MWKKLTSFFKERPKKRRLYMSKDEICEYLFHLFRIREETDFINLDESDILQLKYGEAAFLYESPLASSQKEAIAMARKAAKKMMPAPGRVVLFMAIMFFSSSDDRNNLMWGLFEITQLGDLLTEALSKDTDVIMGTESSNEKGMRFVIVTTEGKRASKPFGVAHDRSVMEELNED